MRFDRRNPNKNGSQTITIPAVAKLDIYALGEENALHLKVANTTVHFLSDGNLAMNPWSSERRVQALTKPAEILNFIDRGKSNPNFSYCAYCLEFRSICPYAAMV